jgi:hypothetical protein
MVPARYTGSFVPGEVLLLVRNLGKGKQSFFFSVWAENWAQMGQLEPGMFRNRMVFMICRIDTIVELQERSADFTNIRNGHVDLEQAIYVTPEI